MTKTKRIDSDITLGILEKARGDNELLERVLNTIFYDESNNPKLRMFLVKIGISYYELDEMEAHLTSVVLEYITGKNQHKYTKEIIPFERFIWNVIWHDVINSFNGRKLKKNQAHSLDDFIEVNGDVIPDNKEHHSTFELDLQIVMDDLNKKQRFICMCIYYSDWKPFEIQNYLGISKDQYATEMAEIKVVFLRHI